MAPAEIRSTSPSGDGRESRAVSLTARGAKYFGMSRVEFIAAAVLFALMIVFKVPGALGGAEKAAHKLHSTVESAFKHALAHAA